jgi:hypothetical protein
VKKGILTGIYRREGDWNLVELKISDPAQLFNSFDPAPFRERDLDADAAEYLVDAIRELRGHRHVRIVIHLPKAHDARVQAGIQEAIRNYFRYREQAARFDVRQALRLGRASLAVGLLFLATCTAISQLALTGEGVAMHTLHEGFLILGWVAMWRPLEILLYEWWPLLRDARLYRMISELEVDVRQLP